MSVEFFIDTKLCSINQKYFVVNGRNILSTKYRQVKAYLTDHFSIFDQDELPSKPYKITIAGKHFADLDAFIKIIFDSLEGAGVIENDKYVTKLIYKKTPAQRGGNEEYFIRVETDNET